MSARLDPDVRELVELVFQHVWEDTEPELVPKDRDRVRNAIASGLVALASAGQHDFGKLTAYAQARALETIVGARR